MITRSGQMVSFLLLLMLSESTLQCQTKLCKPTNAAELINCDVFGKGCSDNYIVELSNKIYQIDLSLVTAKSNVTIIGNNAIIKCCGNVGLKVTNSPHVCIRNVTFLNCGLWQNTTSPALGMKKPLVKTAVYIAFSSLVSLSYVNIRESTGTGLSLFNCRERIIIKESTFSKNKMKSDYPGGGGVSIQHNSKDSALHGTSYTITNCHFIDNNASSSIKFNSRLVGQDLGSKSFSTSGNGGGLSINMLRANGVFVKIHGSYFRGNTAYQGCGLFVIFFNDSMNNSIEISDCHFDSNHCVPQVIPKSIISAGGGVAVLSLLVRHRQNNTCLIKDTHFMNNTAFFGGGLSLRTWRSQYIDDSHVNSNFIIQDSQLSNNNARLGSAIDLFCSWTNVPHSRCLVQPTLSNTNITGNGGIYTYRDKETKGMTFSAVHIQGLQTHFTGRVVISQNYASGVGLDEAVMMIDANATVLIENNEALRGGGIAAIGNSQVFLSPHSFLSITSNSVTYRGGGLYSGQTADSFNVYSYSCFIKYLDKNSSTNVHPNNWTAHVNFSQNVAAGKPNSIFVSSILPCVWPSGEIFDVTADINSTFCNWNSWHFDEHCHESIKTLPQRFSEKTYSVEVYPLHRTVIKNFEVFDDFMNIVTNDTSFVSLVIGEEMHSSAPQPDFKENSLIMTGQPNHYELHVQTLGDRSVSATVKVTLKECPVGYILNNYSCKCDIDPANNNLQCNYENITLRVFVGHCIGYGVFENNGSNKTVISKCPFTVESGLPYREIQCTKLELNDKFCSMYHRQGPLCRECKAGRGIDVFSSSFQCMTCTNDTVYFHWMSAIAAIIVPQTILFIVVIAFHIGITSPSMNAYIFFSHVTLFRLQVIVMKIAWNLHQTISKKLANLLTNLAMDPFRLWSFDYPVIFNYHVCLGEDIKIVHAIAFQYIHAFYPMLLVVLALVFIELHARNCKPVVFMWKPFNFLCIYLRRNWEIKTSVIDAFATVILLSYSKVITTSLSLLTANHVYTIQDANGPPVTTLLDYDTATEFFHKEHKLLAIFAIVTLLTFGCFPPILLTFYPYRCFNKLLSLVRLHRWYGLYVFVQTFQGYLKDGTNGTPDRRWFAGTYFFFRIIIFLELTLINDISVIFVVLTITYTAMLLFVTMARPYKKECYNNLDILFLTILVALNFLVNHILSYVQQKKKLPRNLWYLTYMLYLVPTLYLLIYLAYLLCTRSRLVKNHCARKMNGVRNRTSRFLANKNTNNTLLDNTFSFIGDYITPHSSLENFSEVPDRVNNPNRYVVSEGPSEANARHATAIGEATRERGRSRSTARSKN